MDYWPTIAASDVTIGGLRKVCIPHRAHQFWHVLTAIPTLEDLNQIRQALTPPLMTLFLSLQPNEQAHSLRIYRQLLQQEETHKDLLLAALLHDVGKSRYPLNLWERVVVVLGKRIFPMGVQYWGHGEPHGWKRSFVVAEQHASWGAEITMHAGASSGVVSFIRRHHDPVKDPFKQQDDQFLRQLQLLDDES